MRVLTFGSTGNAGRYIIPELLAQGHEVTTLVRNRGRVDSQLGSSPNLTIVEGDVLNEADIKQAFVKATVGGNLDAVISSISEGLDVKSHLQSKGTRLILDALDNTDGGKKPRLLLFASTGMLDAPKKDDASPPQLWKYAPEFPAMFRSVSEEHEKIYDMLRQERNLEWTLLCPPMITDHQADGQFVVAKGVFASSKFEIKSGNLARFIVEELKARKFINERVGISDA